MWGVELETLTRCEEDIQLNETVKPSVDFPQHP
jgi:hypothetical protein